MDKLFRVELLKKEIRNLNSLIIIILDALDNNTGTLNIENTKDTIDIIIDSLEKIILEFERIKRIFIQCEYTEKISLKLQEVYSLLKILDNGLINFSKHNIHFYDIYIFINTINDKYKTLLPLMDKLILNKNYKNYKKDKY